jgi:hypothetical protein
MENLKQNYVVGQAWLVSSYESYCVLRKEGNPNRCNYLYFDHSKVTYLC